ncbi:hypothetical protein V5799_032549 [Amblyomma americanum]|uniref:Uncharacterized protein n=1 Tax=Amblyomma americanum TaxID=6943 RepID=A0AAQ4DQV0_AMBAM
MGVIDVPVFQFVVEEIPSLFDCLKVCNHKEYSKLMKYDVRYDVVYTKKGDSHIFTYDNEKAFFQKLCKLKANHTKLKYGIAVYDLEYEDYNGLCALQKHFEGPYSRLQALRKIVDFSKSFIKPQDRERCFKLDPKQ